MAASAGSGVGSRPLSSRTRKTSDATASSKIRFRCDYSSTPLKVLQARGWTRIQDPRDPTWDIWWCETSELKNALDGPQRLQPRQRVSHFRNHCELTRKNYLYRNLRRYKRLLIKAGMTREAELCDAMPMSFELPSEYRMLVEEHRRCHGITWIVKPAAGSQGRGIFLFQRLKDLAEWRAKECMSINDNTLLIHDSNPPQPQPTYVVQKYIDKPYLLEGRKFDLRIYVLVTSFQPLKVWLAREGFARLSGEQFSLERIGERRVHLTNMSIQLKPGRNEHPSLGRKWPLSCLRRYLTARHGPETVQRLLRAIAAVAAPQVPVTNGIHKEEDKLQDSEFPPEQDNNKTSQKRRKGIKTLRIRWLHKGPKDKRYKPMPKSQGGGMRKLKLDESRSYSASDICQLAIEAFELCPANEPEHELAELGLFGGHSIDTFRLRDRADVCDDIWDYCRLRSTGLYNLNLYLLTRPRAPDDVRLLYRYARLSKYSSESFYTECSRGQLHSYVLEQHCGDGPSLDEFEPLELGYRLSRFEKDGKVLLQMKIEEEEEGSMSKNYEFPQAASEPGEHEIVHDLIRGVYNGTLGLGLVVSCTEACRPIYTWYRDGEVYKSAEYLCWLSGIKDERDGQSHVWSCMVTCQASDKQLKSKEVEIED